MILEGLNIELAGCETAVKDNYTFVRSAPKLFRLVLPLAGWKVTSPSVDTNELLLAVRPSLRVSVKWMMTPKMPSESTERAWLDLWLGMDGLLLLPAAEPQAEVIVPTPKGRLLLDRRLAKRSRSNPAELLAEVAWQLVTPRLFQDGCLFFVVLANRGAEPISPEDTALFIKVADSFDVAQ